MTEVHEVHKHLYHYTNFNGLKGILETQTLWATHFRYLNDSSEIKLMRSRIENILFERIKLIIRDDMNGGFTRRRYWENHGGITKASRREAKILTDVFYETTLLGAPSTIPIAPPYILSFCSHMHHDGYVKKNGLLSQWRAYGENGGYALIFDTKRLYQCLKVEAETYQYAVLNFGDVVYDDQSDKFQTEFTDLFGKLERWVRDFATEDMEHQPEEVIQPFFSATTRFKHRGFKEESEVRVSFAPISKAFAESANETSSVNFKPILARKKGDDQVQYIALNDVPKKKPLPILQIIVGPQRDQERRALEVKHLVGKKKIQIICSQTPYLPPQARISG